MEKILFISRQKKNTAVHCRLCLAGSRHQCSQAWHFILYAVSNYMDSYFAVHGGILHLWHDVLQDVRQTFQTHPRL